MEDRDRKIAQLENEVKALKSRFDRLPPRYTPDEFGEVFVANVTAFSTKMRWKEQTNVGGTVGDFTDGRACTATDASNAIPLTETQFLSLEIDDGEDSRYFYIPNGCFPVYLTQVGGSNGDDGSTTTLAFPTYTYDVYIDSAKTIKIGAAVSVIFHRLLQVAVTAATHGIARWNGTTCELWFVDEYEDRGDC